MGKKLNPSNIVPCRKCENNVSEITKVCNHCGIDSPGITSECPDCGSINYTFQTSGFTIKRALAGAILLGPIGLSAGVIGFNDVECICKNCGQGWLPFGVIGGKFSKTKKHWR